MLELRGDVNLAQEPIGADHRRQLGSQHLHCNLAIVLHVSRAKHDRHTALGNLALDPISIRECCLKSPEDIGHRDVSLLVSNSALRVLEMSFPRLERAAFVSKILVDANLGRNYRLAQGLQSGESIRVLNVREPDDERTTTLLGRQLEQNQFMSERSRSTQDRACWSPRRVKRP